MTKLSATCFAGLEALAREPDICLQYVRFGDWLDSETIRQAIPLFPGQEFLYHHNGSLRASEPETRALVAALRDRQQCTQCPWLSAHLDQHTDEEIHALIYEGQRPPRYDAGQAFELLCRAVKIVQAQLAVPLLLENMQHWPLPEIDIAVTPDFIRRVLDAIGCDLLLDTAHARISAAALGCDVQSYLSQFPLDRTVEIHVSSPRREKGEWVNCHEALQEEDYALLEWLLQRTAPEAVTLEYWRNPAQAREQMLHLARLIAGQSVKYAGRKRARFGTLYV